jgi:uncharacterized protein YeeX (DUF496 family)
MSSREKLFLYVASLSEEDVDDALWLLKFFLGKEEHKEEHKETPKPFYEEVYCIKHNKTGKEYIGRSGSCERRIKEHMSRLRKGKHPVEDMQADYDKFGEDYTITVIGKITDYRDISTEFELMNEHGSYIRGKGYNYKDRCFPRWKRRSEKNDRKGKAT